MNEFKNLKDILKIYQSKGFVENIHYQIIDEGNISELFYDNGIYNSSIAKYDNKLNELVYLSSKDDFDKSIQILSELESIRKSYFIEEKNTSIMYLNNEVELSDDIFKEKLSSVIELERTYKNQIKKIDPKNKEVYGFFKSDMKNLTEIKKNLLNGYKQQNKEVFYVGSLYKFNYRDIYSQVEKNINSLVENNKLLIEEVNDTNYIYSIYIENFKEELIEKEFEEYKHNEKVLLDVLSNVSKKLKESKMREEEIMKEVPSKDEATENVLNGSGETVKTTDGKEVKYINNVDYLINNIRANSNWELSQGLDIKYRTATPLLKDIKRNKIEEGRPVIKMGERIICSYDKDTRKIDNVVLENDVVKEIEIYKKYQDYKKTAKDSKDFENIYDLKTYLQTKYNTDVFSLKVDNVNSEYNGKTLLKIGSQIVGETFKDSINIKYTVKLDSIKEAVDNYKEYKKSQSNEEIKKEEVVEVKVEEVVKKEIETTNENEVSIDSLLKLNEQNKELLKEGTIEKQDSKLSDLKSNSNSKKEDSKTSNNDKKEVKTSKNKQK
jgi:hypothetical protein